MNLVHLLLLGATLAQPASASASNDKCLAGVCLGAEVDSAAPKMVTVAGMKMERYVEVCSGKVAEVSVNHFWAQLDPAASAFAGDMPAHWDITYSRGQEAEQWFMDTAFRTFGRLLTDHGQHLGWACFEDKAVPPSRTMYHCMKGSGDNYNGRTLVFDKMVSIDTDGLLKNGFFMSISQSRQDYNDLCQAKQLEGL